MGLSTRPNWQGTRRQSRPLESQSFGAKGTPATQVRRKTMRIRSFPDRPLLGLGFDRNGPSLRRRGSGFNGFPLRYVRGPRSGGPRIRPTYVALPSSPAVSGQPGEAEGGQGPHPEARGYASPHARGGVSRVGGQHRPGGPKSGTGDRTPKGGSIGASVARPGSFSPIAIFVPTGQMGQFAQPEQRTGSASGQ